MHLDNACLSGHQDVFLLLQKLFLLVRRQFFKLCHGLLVLLQHLFFKVALLFLLSIALCLILLV